MQKLLLVLVVAVNYISVAGAETKAEPDHQGGANGRAAGVSGPSPIEKLQQFANACGFQGRINPGILAGNPGQGTTTPPGGGVSSIGGAGNGENGGNGGGSGSGGANSGNSGDASRGSSLFSSRCANCHNGGSAPDRLPISNFSLAVTLVDNGKMPKTGFPKSGAPLSEQEKADLKAFLRTKI